MNKPSGFLFFMLFLSFSPRASAQGENDSVFMRLAATVPLSFAYKSGTFLLAEKTKENGLATISFDRVAGSFRKSDDPHTRAVAGFYSEGFTTLKKVRISGRFRYSRTWDDSLAYTLQGIENDAQPFYYFAAKAGEYERQDYDMGTLITLPVIEGKLFFSMGVDYRYHWTTRSVDPRPDVRHFQMLLKPGLTWTRNNHYSGFHLVWGSGNEKSDIGYKNRNYAENRTYLERNSFLNLGYGHYTWDQTGLNRYNKFQGASFSYAYENTSWTLKANAAYLHQKETNTFDRSPVNFTTMGIVHYDNLSAEWLVQKRKSRLLRQLSVNALLSAAVNWSGEFNATNFQYRKQYLKLDYSHCYLGKALKPEIALQAGMEKMLKEDVSSSHHLEVSAVFAGARFSAVPHKKSISLCFNPVLFLPLRTSLSHPATQKGFFTEWIAYPEYLYLSTPSLRLNSAFRYFPENRLKGNTAPCIGVRCDWMAPIKTSQEFPGAAYRPSGSRVYTAVFFQLYL